VGLRTKIILIPLNPSLTTLRSPRSSRFLGGKRRYISLSRARPLKNTLVGGGFFTMLTRHLLGGVVGTDTKADSEGEKEGRFSFWVGVSFCVNYIM